VKLTDLKAGDCVWIDDHGTHPGVVMHVDAKSAVVIRGTGTGRPHMTEVCVSERTPAGRAMNLNKPTYFNATRYSVISDAAKIVNKTGKKCPFDVFTKLEALIAPLIASVKAVAQAQQLAAPAPAPTQQPATVPATPPANTQQVSAPSAAAATATALPITKTEPDPTQ
jgi:hypothetical protein